MKFISLLTLLLATSVVINAQRSIFDRALIIDSLYDRILDGEEELADPFFAQLRALYPGGKNLTNEAVRIDLTRNNAFLNPKLNFVYNLLDQKVEETDAEGTLLREGRKELLALAKEAALSACPTADCDFVYNLNFFFEDKAAITIRETRERLAPEYADLAKLLRDIEVRLYELDVKIDRLKRRDEALFRDGEDVALGLPVGGGETVDQTFAPVIIQSGGGSAQGAIIDGAGRWIAERMREELSIAFFDRFEVWLEEKKMTHLFPATIRALDITSVTDYSLMMQVLRTAFEGDLRELPFNIGPFLREELAEEGDAEYIQYEADEAFVAYRLANLDWWTVEDNNNFEDTFNAEEVLRDNFERLANTNKGLNYVLFSIAAMQELSQGNHPVNLLNILNERSDDLFPQGGDVRPVLMMADVLVRSFVRLDGGKGTTWISRRELTRLSRDQQLRDIYFGLILHELHRNLKARENRLLAERKRFAGGVPYVDGIDFTDLGEEQLTKVRAELDNENLIRVEQRLYLLEQDRYWVDGTFSRSLDKVGAMLNELSLFTERMDNLQRQHRELQLAGQGGLGNPQTIELIRHSLTVIKPVLSLALKDETRLNRIERLSEGILDAYTGVLEKDYDAVILNVIPVANTLLDVDYAEALEANKGESKALTELRAGEHGARKRKMREVFRYGAFLAAVAESKNPEDIKQAIRAIALPTGSYSIKRRSFANISLNAYPGLTGGYELIQNELGRRWAPNTGFTAPLGLNFSWGYRSKIDNKRYLDNQKYRRRVDRSLDMREERFLTGHSGSLFFSLLDLGAVVLFRLDGSDNSLPEDVGFQQVFSPGVMYSHGFPNIPISVLAGIQVSPQLRKFGDEPADSFRFNLGVTVDLPMANFHTRSVEREE